MVLIYILVEEGVLLTFSFPFSLEFPVFSIGFPFLLLHKKAWKYTGPNKEFKKKKEYPGPKSTIFPCPIIFQQLIFFGVL